MSDSPKKPPVTNDRRRVSRIVHDERGNARVEWVEVADERQHLFDRPQFEIDDSCQSPAANNSASGKSPAPKAQPLSVERQRSSGFDPYQRVDTAGRTFNDRPKTSGKRDLRKLGEWLKIKREVEERRARGDTDDDER
jgi:hypothetical protein